MKRIFLIIILINLFFPLVALAYNIHLDSAGQSLIYKGLVPCGKPINAGGTITTVGNEQTIAGGTCCLLHCTFCHLLVMLDGIFDFVLFQLVPALAVLMLAIGGIMYIIAHFSEGEILPGGGAGGPKMLGQAKRLMTSIVIGLVIIYAGWLIIDLFFDAIGVAEWTGLNQGWFSIKCPIATVTPCDPTVVGSCPTENATPCWTKQLQEGGFQAIGPEECL